MKIYFLTMFKYTLAIFYSLIVFNFLLVAWPAVGVEPAAPVAKPKGLSGAVESLKKVGPDIGQAKTLEEVIGGIISAALALVGVIFLALTVYGGYLWMLARENEEQAKKAMQIIKMAVIGLAVVLGAYAITFFVVARLTRATG